MCQFVPFHWFIMACVLLGIPCCAMPAVCTVSSAVLIIYLPRQRVDLLIYLATLCSAHKHKLNIQGKTIRNLLWQQASRGFTSADSFCLIGYDVVG